MPSGSTVARCVERLVVVAIALCARHAFAHQTSVKYVALAIDGPRVAVAIRVAPGDVTEPMHLPADAAPTLEQAVAAPGVPPYVAHWLAIVSHGDPCPASPPVARADEDGKLVAVTWTVTCASADELALDLSAFFAVDQRHIAIVRVEQPGTDPIDAIVRANASTLVLRVRPSLLAWVHAGMDHIYDGRDHISFVLALLLVVMLYRATGDPGESSTRGTWHARALVPTLKSTATVITAFTVAHSVSLIAASLGWIQLPSRLVESLIALSIAYTAVENVIKPDVRWRFALTFGFGLVHGLGFASVLSEMLPPRDVIVPLLCFNLGVELGQLTIVLVALPMFYLSARRLGPERYRRIAMPMMSALIFVLGLIWLIERVFRVTILGM